MNILLKCTFSGLFFHGTQKQSKERTIQGEFESALSRIYDTKIRTVISSRLDKGVNAYDFALSFKDESSKFDTSHLLYYLRRTIPEDIFVISATEVDNSFSARHSAIGKKYLYRIQNNEQRDPLLNSFTYTPIKALDKDKLEKSGLLFIGTHDFRYLSSPEKKDENTILKIDAFSLTEEENILSIRFMAKSFLRYQIRFMVGAMINESLGIISKEDIKKLLEGENIKYRKLKARAEGLTLEKTFYDQEEWDKEVYSLSSNN